MVTAVTRPSRKAGEKMAAAAAAAAAVTSSAVTPATGPYNATRTLVRRRNAFVSPEAQLLQRSCHGRGCAGAVAAGTGAATVICVRRLSNIAAVAAADLRSFFSFLLSSGRRERAPDNTLRPHVPAPPCFWPYAGSSCCPPRLSAATFRRIWRPYRRGPKHVATDLRGTRCRCRRRRC